MLLSYQTFGFVISILLQGVTYSSGLERHASASKVIKRSAPGRPIWNVAHMVNSIEQVDSALDTGANAIEFDVDFDRDGGAKYVHHGVPCDCFRYCTYYERSSTFLNHLSRLTSPGDPKFRKGLVLLIMDLKTKRLSQRQLAYAGQQLVQMLLHYYWKQGTTGARAYILLTLPSTYQIELFKSVTRYLRLDMRYRKFEQQIGFDFSRNEDLHVIEDAYRRASIRHRIWQSDGITNCLARGTTRLEKAIGKRNEDSYMSKVYWWTVDKKSGMRNVLRLGVDGIITNYPNRLSDILNHWTSWGVYRLATIEDEPWPMS